MTRKRTRVCVSLRKGWRWGWICLATATLIGAGCGKKFSSSGDLDGAVDGGGDAVVMGGDGTVGGDAAPGICGNAILEAGEECDDGNTSNDDFCTSDCRIACGDGIVQPVEECDTAIPAGDPGACPIICDDGDDCTTDQLTGTGCDALCVYGAITAFVDDDGCCPPGGNETNDNDCQANCGNGVLETGETCDPPASCPTGCDDGDACTIDALSGTAAMCDALCSNAPITICAAGDACCPAGCNAANDADCASVCGNSVVEPGETCDPPGSCPVSCDDGDACTIDTLGGDPTLCTAACTNATITACADGDGCCAAGCDAGNDNDCSATCGNSVVEPGETCDPPGSCPTSCDDGNVCTTDTLSGSAANCTAACTNTPVTNCLDGDGCCAPGCDANNDDDCSSICGNSVVEPGETCDPPGSCPVSCDDGNTCTADSMSGSAASCNVSCSNQPIISCLDGDGCCPGGCDATNDNDCSASCGNSIVEPGETCDPPGSCPVSCDDGNACTTDTMTGSAANCNVQCTNSPVVSCVDGDGCCAPGCDANNDNDCSAVCGNSVVEPGETCDPPGSCPASCDDGNACTTDTLSGSAATCTAACTNAPVVNCLDGDGCCAPGCDGTNDNDCSSICGNSVVEPGETCDPPGSCPVSCDDGNACTADSMSGSAANCDVVCTNAPIAACTDADGCCPPGCDATNDNDCSSICGNSVVEPGETCDPPGTCPVSCDDGNACTTDTLSGSAATCTASCSNIPVVNCIDGDGCCAPGCDATNDNDCAAICGNSVVEPGETCDPPGSCPASCDDGNACTADSMSGSAANCDVLCTNTPIGACTNGDGCCPAGCNAANDNDCSANCGNSVVEPGETCDPPASCPASCDDGNSCTADTMTGSPANCNVQCTNTPIVSCTGGDACCPAGCNNNNDSDCAPVCGNSVVEGGETCDPPASCPASCDDGNVCTADSQTGNAATCDVQCSNTPIVSCTGGDGCCPAGCNNNNDSDCAPVCGNSVVESGETCDPPGTCPVSCDDGNVCTADSMSGSAANCNVTCTNTPIGSCTGGDGCCPGGCNANNDSDCSPVCGNSVVESGETCDPPGSCPASCDDGNVCTADSMSGSAATCDVQCTNAPIVSCTNGDGCCAPGCNNNNDTDCSPICGNSVVESGETCDPPASCPASCDDGNACTADSMTGSAANCNVQCNNTPIVSCTGGDGCCAPGCNNNNDNDCAPVCGNSVVESGETCDPPGSCPVSCDDGNVCTADSMTGSAANCDVQCTNTPILSCTNGDGCCAPGCNNNNDNDCAPVCGNSVVESGETCDPPGSCPVSCDDGNVCTADSMTGSAANCNVQCNNTPIVSCTGGDGCCPGGCNNNNDSDCAPVCGNSVIESGETCDPPGSCPVSCNDGNACTADSMTGAPATCDVQCTNTPIVSCANGDGCCAPGCNNNNDNDCAPVCGNSVVESGETCDPPASCPVSCDDGNVCTADSMSGSAATCNVQCTNTPVVACTNGDGCCPAGCNETNDNDCAPVCGNNVIETGEQCDDGNTTNGDGCDSNCQLEAQPPTVFRVDAAWLRDPHVFLNVGFFCIDGTDGAPFGNPGVNLQLNDAITMDTDGDTFLDLSLMLIFRPLDQTVPYTGNVDFSIGLCTAPMAGTVCDQDPGNPPQPTTYINSNAGDCLAPYPGTTSGYTPGVTNSSPPCFSAGPINITLNLAGTPINLQDAEVGATYIGNPATSLANGLLRGFISEADADVTMIDLGALGVFPLSQLLPGGTGNCDGGDDRDLGLDGVTVGWWFYLNYTAVPVTYIGP